MNNINSIDLNLNPFDFGLTIDDVELLMMIE